MSNMLNKFFQIPTFVFCILVLSRCSESTTEPNNSVLPDGISGLTSIKYTLLSNAPIHTQTTMISKYQNRLFRFGSRAPIQILDLVNGVWTEIVIIDSTLWRWDGAAVNVEDSIFVVAISVASNSYDILRLNLMNTVLEHTNVNLPTYFHYPAYCVKQDKIMFFSIQCDSVFEYNTTNSNLIKIAENPFFSSEDINLTLSSGKHLNYFYVFGGYSTLPKNIFYRLNLSDNHWEQLPLPTILEKKQLQGASFEDHFIFLCDSVSTYEYRFSENKWYLDTTRVPIYVRDLTGKLMQGEWSFATEDSCLYGTENLADKVWRISK